MDFNKKICNHLFMYLFIYLFMCLFVMLELVFVVLLQLQVFFSVRCTVCCSLYWRQFFGKHRKRCSQTAQYYICSYLQAAQLFSYYLCTQSMWTGNIWWRFSPLLWHRAIILFVGRASKRDFVAHAEFLFRSVWNSASVSRFTMPFFSCLTVCQDSDYLLLTRPNLLS